MNSFLILFSIASCVVCSYCWMKWQVAITKVQHLEIDKECQKAYNENVLEIAKTYREQVDRLKSENQNRKAAERDDEIDYKQLERLLVKLGTKLGGGEFLMYSIFPVYYADGCLIIVYDSLGNQIRSSLGPTIENVVKSLEPLTKEKA